MHASELIDFWRLCELGKPPFAHPEDWPVLRKRPNLIDDESTNFETFVSGLRFEDFKKSRLRLSLLPSPYCGNLRTGDVFILQLNPGFSLVDYHAETCMPNFRRRLERMLRQDFEGIDFPFVFLDPEFCWHSGFSWWENRLRDVIGAIARAKFDGRYVEALRSLSKRLVALELVPYHSSSFAAHSLLEKLPSCRTMKRFAQQLLAETEACGDKTIIGTRQTAAWGLSERPPNVICYKGVETRGARLECSSRGGKAILARYGISKS